MLFSLLEKDPNKRITWDAFFNHELIKKTDPFEEENKLLEISGLDSFPSIPNTSFKNRFYINNKLYSDTNKETNFNNLITSNENSLFFNSPSPNNKLKIINSSLEINDDTKNDIKIIK